MVTYKKSDFDSIDELIEALQGSCYDLDTEGLTDKELEYIDENIFICVSCGWWCESGDYNSEACEATGEDVCSECDWE